MSKVVDSNESIKKKIIDGLDDCNEEELLSIFFILSQFEEKRELEEELSKLKSKKSTKEVKEKPEVKEVVKKVEEPEYNDDEQFLEELDDDDSNETYVEENTIFSKADNFFDDDDDINETYIDENKEYDDDDDDEFISHNKSLGDKYDFEKQEVKETKTVEPVKEQSVTESTEPKKKRGRKKKAIVEEQEIKNNDSSVTESVEESKVVESTEPEKKHRGRKKKVVVEEVKQEVKEEQENTEEILVEKLTSTQTEENFVETSVDDELSKAIETLTTQSNESEEVKEVKEVKKRTIHFTNRQARFSRTNPETWRPCPTSIKLLEDKDKGIMNVIPFDLSYIKDYDTLSDVEKVKLLTNFFNAYMKYKEEIYSKNVKELKHIAESVKIQGKYRKEIIDNLISNWINDYFDRD